MSIQYFELKDFSKLLVKQIFYSDYFDFDIISRNKL